MLDINFCRLVNRYRHANAGTGWQIRILGGFFHHKIFDGVFQFDGKFESLGIKKFDAVILGRIV